MSIHTTQITDGKIGGRFGYRVIHDRRESHPTAITLDVWDNKYNVEWRSSVELKDFIDYVTRLDGISGETEAQAYLEGDELKKEEPTLADLRENKEKRAKCGNLHVSRRGFDVYWEDTKDKPTIEFTSYDGNFDVFASLYQDTNDESRANAERLVEEIRMIISN